MKFFKNKKGFTLVELVVVIAILGILAGIAIPRFMNATASAKGAKVVADLRTIDSACMMYLAKEGTAVADSVNGAGLTGTYIASWPVPPAAGVVSIVRNSGVAVDYTITDATYAVVGGRGTLDAHTIDTILLPATAGK